MCIGRMEAPSEAARAWALAEAARRRESTAESTLDRSQYSEPSQVPPCSLPCRLCWAEISEGRSHVWSRRSVYS